MDRSRLTNSTHHDELDEFAPEAPLRRDPSYTAGHPMSQPARAIYGHALALLALVATRCDSISYVAARGARRARATAQRWRAGVEAALTSSRASGPRKADPIDEREMEGSFVAAALACTVVAYGAMLAITWRDPAPHLSVSARATPDGVFEGTSADTMATLLPIRANRVSSAPLPGIVRAQHAPSRVNAASLRSIWNRGDTRSLERALTHLRQQTLTLHRCGMQVTAADQAIAHCDGPSRESYTIDFRRTSGRWSIQRVSSR